jgi:hypothetical protein
MVRPKRSSKAKAKPAKKTAKKRASPSPPATTRTFPRDAPDRVIKDAIVEWSELLALERYADALAMFLSVAREKWTPAKLETWIVNYGSPEPVPGEPRRKITSLRAHPDAALIIEKKIEVDREDLFGLDPKQYLGMVHYGQVPLDGQRSDLTARFHIKKVGADRMTLEFLDIHVM